MNILRIVANNFKLCENDFTIDFVPKANKTVYDREFELNEIDDELYVYKTMGIIGKNASGKSTTADLLSVVYDIFSNFRIKNSASIFRHIDDTIKLDITFYYEHYLYRYITNLCKDKDAVDNTTILFSKQRLYRRSYLKSYSRKLYDYEKYEEMISDTLLPDDTSILFNVFKIITFRGIYCPAEDNIYKDYASYFNLYKLLNDNYKIVEAILKMFDEHLENIKMIDNNKFKIMYTNQKDREVSGKELYEILSSGTTKGFGLYTFVVYSLKNGCDLVIDEIENHFHKTLVENLVNLYKDKSVNKNNATLIFTTHYCELLDLFSRNDNIYISKYDKVIHLENMHENYDFRPELSKSNKFYNNAFNTNVDYESLMNFKKDLM